MTFLRLLLPLFALAFFFDVSSAEARGGHGLYNFCECTGHYQPPRGVVKYYTMPIKIEWEHRKECLPCGKIKPYRVKVITYRDRYSNGVQRTWKCVVFRSKKYCYTCYGK